MSYWRFYCDGNDIPRHPPLRLPFGEATPATIEYEITDGRTSVYRDGKRVVSTQNVMPGCMYMLNDELRMPWAARMGLPARSVDCIPWLLDFPKELRTHNATTHSQRLDRARKQHYDLSYVQGPGCQFVLGRLWESCIRDIMTEFSVDGRQYISAYIDDAAFVPNWITLSEIFRNWPISIYYPQAFIAEVLLRRLKLNRSDVERVIASRSSYLTC